MSEMQDKDSYEVFAENMKKAISISKQLAKATDIKQWTWFAKGLEGLLGKGNAMYSKPAPNHADRMAMVDQFVEKTVTQTMSNRLH